MEAPRRQHHHRHPRFHKHRNKPSSEREGLLLVPDLGDPPPTTPLSLTWYSPVPLPEEDFAENGRGEMDILPHEDQGPHGFARQWLLYEHRGWHVGRKFTVVPLSFHFPHPWKRARRVARGGMGGGNVGKIAGVEANAGGGVARGAGKKTRKRRKGEGVADASKDAGPVTELIDPKQSAFAHAVRKPMTMPVTRRSVLASAVRGRVRPEWRDAGLVLYSGPGEDALGLGGALRAAGDGSSFHIFFADADAGSGAADVGSSLPRSSVLPPVVATRVFDDATGIMTGMRFQVPHDKATGSSRSSSSSSSPDRRRHADDKEALAAPPPSPSVDTFMWRYTNNLGLSTQSLANQRLRPGQHCSCLRFLGSHPHPQPTFSLLHCESGHEVAFFSKSNHGGGNGRGDRPSSFIVGLHTTWMNFRWTEWATAKAAVAEKTHLRVRARRGEQSKPAAADPMLGTAAAMTAGKLSIPGRDGSAVSREGAGVKMVGVDGGSSTAAAFRAESILEATENEGGEEEQWVETTVDRMVETNLSRQAAYIAVLTAMGMALNIMPCPEDAKHGHHHAKHRRREPTGAHERTEDKCEGADRVRAGEEAVKGPA